MNETIAQEIRKSNHKYFMVETFYDGEKETVRVIKSLDKLSTAIVWVMHRVDSYQITSIRFCGDMMVELFQRHLNGTCHRVCYKSMKRQARPL